MWWNSSIMSFLDVNCLQMFDVLLEDGSILICLPFILGSPDHNGSKSEELLGVIKIGCTDLHSLFVIKNAFLLIIRCLLYPLKDLMLILDDNLAFSDTFEFDRT
nr:hypothetical protein [Tanacetum cinerariifolium]